MRPVTTRGATRVMSLPVSLETLRGAVAVVVAVGVA